MDRILATGVRGSGMFNDTRMKSGIIMKENVQCPVFSMSTYLMVINASSSG